MTSNEFINGPFSGKIKTGPASSTGTIASEAYRGFSLWNTPNFVIHKKTKNKFRLLYDLRDTNAIMKTMGLSGQGSLLLL